VTILSAEAEPRLIKFSEREAVKALHTYGTTGIMVEIEMRLAPARRYQQLIVNGPDWHALLQWTDALARQVDIPKRLVTQFEHPVPTFFKPLKKYLKDGEHATFLLIDVDYSAGVVEAATAAGLSVVYDEPLKEPLKPPYITDYTWNHGTLWAIKTDPVYTYLQVGYGENFSEQMDELRAAFPDEIYQHLEWTAWRTEFDGTTWPAAKAEDISIGGLPKIRYTTAERLAAIMEKCAEIGVGVANPHTFVLEEGGRHPDLPEKLALKADIDPKGLLNPGKMKSYPVNPFSKAIA
jgi:FAD/FMN-containing dehydrogenase